MPPPRNPYSVLRILYPALLLLGACQIAAGGLGQDEAGRLREENEALRQEIGHLKKLLDASSAKPSSESEPVAPSLPTSVAVDLEQRASLGRAKQDQLVAEYGEAYVADTYRRALLDTPEDPVALYLAARFSPDPDDQLSFCDKAVRLAPSFGFAYHCRSLAYIKKGRGEEALKDALRAQELSSSTEVAKNAKTLKQKSMDWFTQPLSGFVGSASVRRSFALGPAVTQVTFKDPKKGLACGKEALSDEEPWSLCAGVLCMESVFSYSFTGPPDPFYDHSEICGESLVFSDLSGKTLFSHTELPCSRVENEKSISARTAICIPTEDTRIGEAYLKLPGESSPFRVPGVEIPSAVPPH